MQELEENVWATIPFSRTFFKGVTLNSSLAESWKFQGDYIVGQFINEFDHQLDPSDFEKQLVKAKPSFSNDNAFKKDLQFTFDENVINNVLLALFNSKKTYSMT